MTDILPIGGGSLSEHKTHEIDREIVDLTGKRTPRALFVPTALSDDPEYIESFREVYGKELGCEVSELLLIEEEPAEQEIRTKINQADLIYVGGGNTLKMMRRWRHLGVDEELLKAYRSDTVLAGLSAGALCWFEHGHSDSMYYYNPDDWEYIRVTCLGFLDGLGYPHFHGEERVKDFRKMVEKHNQFGLAIDDCTALHVQDDRYRVLTSGEGGNVYRVAPIRGKGTAMDSIRNEEFRPLSELYSIPDGNSNHS